MSKQARQKQRRRKRKLLRKEITTSKDLNDGEKSNNQTETPSKSSR